MVMAHSIFCIVSLSSYRLPDNLACLICTPCRNYEGIKSCDPYYIERWKLLFLCICFKLRNHHDAAAKLLQSCLTLRPRRQQLTRLPCPLPGILQARTLEWVAIWAEAKPPVVSQAECLLSPRKGSNLPQPNKTAFPCCFVWQDPGQQVMNTLGSEYLGSFIWAKASLR